MAASSPTCTRSPRTTRPAGYRDDDRRARGGAVRDHRLRRRQPAAQRRQPGRVRRAAGDPRLSPQPGRRPAHGVPDPRQRPRHQRRQRRDGGDGGRRRALRRRRQRRPRRPARQGRRSAGERLAAIMVTYPRRTVCSRQASASCARSSTRRVVRCTSTAPTSTPSSGWPGRARSVPTSATSICTRRSASRTAAAARASARSPCAPHLAPFLPGDPLGGDGPAGRAGVGGAVRVGWDPADPVGVHPHDGRRGTATARPRWRSCPPTTSPRV